MKKICLIVSIVLLTATAQKTNSQGFIGIPVAGAVAKDVVNDIIKKASDQIATLMGVAARNGDYLLEKNLSRVNVMISNLTYSLSKDLDKRFDQISTEEQQAIYDLNKLTNDAIKNSSSTVLRTSEFLVMDVNDLLNRIPFLKGKSYISSIDGLGQQFRDRGNYSIVCRGTVYKIDNQDSIFVNGKLLSQDLIRKDEINVLKFDIPANELNNKFKIYDLARVKIVIKTFKPQEVTWYKPSTWFSNDLIPIAKYVGNLQLLPKVPVRSYTLLQSTQEDRFSDAAFQAAGHTLLPRSPIKNGWTWGTVEVTIPPGCLMIKGSAVATGETGIGWVSTGTSYTYNDATNTVSSPCGSQWYDTERNFYITCNYRKPETFTKDTKVYLQHLGTNVTGGLYYGTYVCHLPGNYGFFILELKFFTGETVTFTPYEQSKSGVTAEIRSAGINAKNLVVTISPT